MKNWLSSIVANLGVVGEIFVFLWKRKLWWLIPLVVILLMFGLLILLVSASGLGPLIYPLF
jgi:hypothetical protein